MMETLDAPKTPPKPLVVIKKGTIFKTSDLPILQTLIKRPNPNVSMEDNPSPKRICPDFAKSIIQEPVIDVNNELTEVESKTQEIKKKKHYNYIKKSNTILGRVSGGVCIRHDEPLPEHQAEGLLQPGDVFSSIEEFNNHITEYAKKWYFYYVRSETRLNKPHGTCVYRCKFFRKHQRCQSTGKRTQKNESISLGCPASVHLKRNAHSDEIKVTLVCHHHTHELSKEVFEKQPHGYRLPQYIKDEIKDLALLNLHPALIRKYVESKVPDLNIGKTVINTVIRLRREGITKDILSDERLTEMLEKIRYINANFDIPLKPRTRRKRVPRYLDSLKSKTNTTQTEVIVKTASSKKGLERDYESTVDDPPEAFSISEMSCDLDTTVENDTEFEDYTHVEDGVVDLTDEQVNEDDGNKSLRLINPTTGTYDEPEPVATENVDYDDLLLINAETGLLDVKVKPIVEPEQTVLLRKYNIGNISIECSERVDESGNATVTLNQIKAKGGLTESNVLNQLSKVEQSINEPIKYSLKADKKKQLKKKNTDKNPLMEATLRCQLRHDPLPEQQAEGLVQVGSKFSSIEELLSYVAAQAPKWFFYYHVFDSRNTKGSPKYSSTKSILYNLNCRFNKGFYKSKSKGLRKVKRKFIQCPAGLNAKCPPGETEFTVTYACHHHSHELSAELFGKEAHGHRLPKELKEEIRVLAWFKLDSALIKQYLEELTGLKMGKTVKNIVATMKKKELKVDVPPGKMSEILEKIKDIKQRFQIRRGPAIRKSKLESIEDDRSDSEKEEVENKSRVETRLDNIRFDHELIQSVRELEENTGCEIELNPWGGADVTNGVNLQEGLQTEYDETQDNNEQTECQIKIDDIVYNMDDGVQYIIPSDQDGSNNIFGVEFAGVGDRIVYIQETGESLPEVDTDQQYDNTVIQEEIHVINEDAIKVQEMDECNEDVYENNAETNEDALNEMNEQNTEEHSVVYVDQNCVNSEEYNQAANEYSNNENQYECMYINEQKEIYYRDVGVQADFAMIELEGEYERISKLESAVVHDNKEESTYSYNSRCQPKYITEEAIINRFNIEFYISQCGVATCMENLASCMGTSVLTLLKHLYRGEAVFKVTSGRSGNQNRRTMNVAYHPLTIAFPFENFKHINYIQEYKSICSKYSDVAMQLENTVQSISKALEAKTLELSEYLSKKPDQNQHITNYEELLKRNTLLEESLQKTQTDLAEMKQENDTLTEKVTHLEQLNISSRIKDAEILQQLLVPTPEQEEMNKIIIENRSLKQKILELSEESIERSKVDVINQKLVESIKDLENSLIQVTSEKNSYKSKIRKLEKLYLTDSQSLLDRIKIHEAQIQGYKEASDDNFAENQNSLKLLTLAETKCRKLEKQVKQLQTLLWSTKNCDG